MEKSEFNKIIKNLSGTVADLSDEEKNVLYECLGINKEEETKTTAVESFLELARTDENIYERYGVYIDKYYKLPMCNRKKICNNVYKNFIRDGHMAIDSVCALIVYEAERVEDEIDPIVQSIRDNNKLYDKRPNIDFSGMKYDI